MSDAVVSTINMTEFFLGYLGLNIGVGQFGSNEGHSLLEKAVNPYGWLPSYTYGYTAGAHYRKSFHLFIPLKQLYSLFAFWCTTGSVY